MPPEPIQFGIVGCGGFGLFALQHYAQVPQVVPTAMGGTHRQAAYAAAQRFGIPDIEDVAALVQRKDVDLIYIATPPFLHYEQAMLALNAGKHVICEKPLATTLQQADEMIATARRQDRLLVANLMQRYNPLFDKIATLINEKILGDLLHGYFENYATDEGLGPDHWFWDPAKSGGIFIEHGVHFFDLFAGWLGAGTVVAAQRSQRPGSGIEDQMQCTVRYDPGTHINFYHGFTQPGRLDRQEIRLVFERGDVTLKEWIPTRVRIGAIADEAGTRALSDLFAGARLDISNVYSPADRSCRGRHKQLDVYQMFELHYGEGRNKMHLYGDLIRALAADQIAWINDRTHQRRITEENGRESLALAVRATDLARESSPALNS